MNLMRGVVIVQRRVNAVTRVQLRYLPVARTRILGIQTVWTNGRSGT